MTHPTLDPLDPHPAHGPHEAAPDPRRWAALTVICLAQFMLVLDVTVVNVALPGIARDLHLDRTTLTWVVTSYTLCFGGLMLLGGRLADALGARRTVTAGLALFTAASLAAGAATGAAMLIGARVAQGVGAALLSPAALSLVTTTFHGKERTKALGVWAGIGGAGSAVGVLLGGALAGGPGWSWIFYVNVPVGVLALTALPRLVAARAPRPSRLDVPGALLVTAATTALIYGLVKAGDTGWDGTATVLPLVGAAVLYALFAVTERRTAAPLMDVTMLTRRPVVAAALLMLIATGLLIATFFLGSVYLQQVRGLSAPRTGLVFLPVAVTTALGAQTASHLLGVVGSRPTAVAGMAVAAVGMVPLTRLDGGTGINSVLMPSLSVAALGIGAVFVTAVTTAMAMVRPTESGLASGVVNTFHEVGGSIGVAVVSTVAATGIEVGSPSGFARAFTVLAVAAGATAVVAVGLVPQGRPKPPGGGHAH
ncbi:MFS transporter [Streptomyces sp. NPDC049040]|uniref:MFS transporter n=1 Tax=Streptomyces sp. NPDC049040 TaxID=3365593 RepID=UPI00371A4250